jgi:hypothetical protein
MRCAVATPFGEQAERRQPQPWSARDRPAWHRHRDARDLVELYHTPGRSLARDDEDPRTTAAADLIDVTPVESNSKGVGGPTVNARA